MHSHSRPGTDPVTDSKTVVEDLAAWLGRVWDEEVQLAATIHAEDCESIPREGYNGPFPCDCGAPTQMLAWIASQRKILALHVYTVDGSGWVDCTNCGEVGNEAEGITECLHRRLLAAPYESRPGFRPEWLVERQGVELR